MEGNAHGTSLVLRLDIGSITDRWVDLVVQDGFEAIPVLSAGGIDHPAIAQSDLAVKNLEGKNNMIRVHYLLLMFYNQHKLFVSISDDLELCITYQKE